MINLVFLKNEEAVCSSRDVAENFEKRHNNVLRDIENLMGGLLKIEQTQRLFRRSFYIDEQNGQRYPMYLMNRDGFTLLAMGFTGEKALDWKLRYIKAFNAMEALIREQATEDYQERRVLGKLSRTALTDTVKALVAYAKAQGSEHADMLYITYSRLANMAAGIYDRALATATQLDVLTYVENVIRYQITIGMQEGKPYKEIYCTCKHALNRAIGLSGGDDIEKKNEIGNEAKTQI